jgi:hypothetical protein
MRFNGRLMVALSLLAAAFVGGDSRAADGGVNVLGNADRTAIRQVIEQQIAAFQRDDGTAAFGCAAPSIRSMFGNSENFMRMVRDGYQPVYRPREFQFGEIIEVEGKIAQRLRVVGPDGRLRLALYMMERQPDGSWLIAGCVLLDLAEDSA